MEKKIKKERNSVIKGNLYRIKTRNYRKQFRLFDYINAISSTNEILINFWTAISLFHHTTTNTTLHHLLIVVLHLCSAMSHLAAILENEVF